MAYLAIARKWRPQKFEDIVGQAHVTRTLQNAIRFSRVHHAFLFTGARGVGKTTAARILAKALNCETGPTPTPCNECRACKEITAGLSADVQEIDAASNTGVDNVRDLRERLRYLPSSSRHRIYVIDEVHMLSTAAFNALLKTLEEPPAHVVFIFATTDPQKVPDTILSRCQRFDFKRIPVKQLAEQLAVIAKGEGIEVSESALLMIAREAEGSMRDAESLLDQVLSASKEKVDDKEVAETLGLFDRRILFDCLRGVLEHQPDLALESVDRVYGFGFDVRPFARDLLELVRHLNVVRLSEKSSRFVDVSAEEFQQLKSLSASVSPEELSRHFDLALKGFDELARSEAPKLALEMTLLRMAQVRPVQSISQLLSRLDDLESLVRRTGGGGRSGSSPQAAGGSSTRSFGGGVSRAGGAALLSGGAAAGVIEERDGMPDVSGGAGVPSRTRAEVTDSRPPLPASIPLETAPSPLASESAGEAQLAEPPEPPGLPLEPTPVAVGGSPNQEPLGPRWMDFLQSHLERGGMPLKFVTGAVPIAEESERIVVAFRNEFSHKQAQRELLEPTLLSRAAEHFGRPMRIEGVIQPDAERMGPSFAIWQEQRQGARRAELRTLELTKPHVKRAMDIFGVRPEDIRIEFGASPRQSPQK